MANLLIIGIQESLYYPIILVFVTPFFFHSKSLTKAEPNLRIDAFTSSIASADNESSIFVLNRSFDVVDGDKLERSLHRKNSLDATGDIWMVLRNIIVTNLSNKVLNIFLYISFENFFRFQL